MLATGNFIIFLEVPKDITGGQQKFLAFDIGRSKAMANPDTQELRNFLIQHEGMSLVPRPDPSQTPITPDKTIAGPKPRRTIGIGRNIDETGFTVDEEVFLRDRAFRRGQPFRDIEVDGITTEEALTLLGNDIQSRSEDIRRAVPDFDDLAPAQQAALISLHFTTGTRGFRGFKEMIKAINKKDFKTAKREFLDSKRVKQKQVGPDRFQAEASMLESGLFPSVK